MGQQTEPRIFWTSYQQEHIEERHEVTCELFEQAWRDRDDLGHYPHPNGPYTVSYGFTDDGRQLDIVWRWQGADVWPITAYFKDESES